MGILVTQLRIGNCPTLIFLTNSTAGQSRTKQILKFKKMKKKSLLLPRALASISMIIFNLTALSQLNNLSEIQNDLSFKRSEFIKHYNSLTKECIYKRDSLITLKKMLIQKNSSSVDSINKLIEHNNTILQTNKVKFENFNTLRNIIENELVALITDKKHKKVFNQFSAADYPLKIIFKEPKNLGVYTLISIDNSNSNDIKVQQVSENKKLNKIYTSFTEENTLKKISRSDLFSWTNSKIAVDASEENLKFNENINSMKIFEKNEISRLDKETSFYNIDVLKSKRNADSTKLAELEKYYNIEYPKSIKEYNINLSLEKKKDEQLINTYNQNLAKYNESAGYCTAMPTEDEARKYFNQFKSALKDPYSAILETYGVKKAKITNEKYPCIKIVKLGVRAKNSWGAYGASEYWVAVKDGKVIDYGDLEKWDIFTGDYMLSQSFEWNSISCNNTVFSKPVYPTTAEQRLSQPVMKEYNFNFFKY